MSDAWGDLPVVEVNALTEDQMAMLDLLSIGRVRQTIPITLLVTPDPAEVAFGSQRHVARHHCPVVTWRGKERIVMPDGALETLTRRADNE